MNKEHVIWNEFFFSFYNVDIAYKLPKWLIQANL